jgi:hypothetical protein
MRKPDNYPIYELKPCDYAKCGGIWYICTPNGILSKLQNHKVIENTNGTISVDPCVRVNDGKGRSWEGILSDGFWDSMY